jgi:hypothetical protein
MSELKIDYDGDSRLAVLETDADDAAWASIKRVCQDHSESVQLLSLTRLSLPWWQFLACRQAINYHVVANLIDVIVAPAAQTLLERAATREKRFGEDGLAQELSHGELVCRLTSKGFTRELTAEQSRNVRRLDALQTGATFSVPGAGKTTEALAFFFLNSKPETRLLVIAPKNAFAAWETQLMLCAPDQREQFVRLTGGDAKIATTLIPRPRFMLITYQQLQFIRERVATEVVEDTFIYLDESHRIKRGLGGRIGSTILSLSYLPEKKLILSGTPMPNSEADLVPQFNFLFPEVDADEETVAALMQGRYVRTTKRELGLREPDRILIPIVMSEAQRRLYQLLRSEAARQAEAFLKAGDRNRLRSLGKSVIRLLQLASNPSLLARNADVPTAYVEEILSEGDSPKLQWTCERARELASTGKKVVVWSTFVENVELIAIRLADLGAQYIHGGVDAGSDEDEDTREWKIKEFHVPDRNWILVANPAACGEGISLHEVCHHAIYVDRNYNAAQYLQSEDRIHRLGLSKNQRTTIEILRCRDSVDESVDHRLVEKVSRMAQVLNDRHLNIDPVSFEPAVIDDDEALDDDDVKDLYQNLISGADDAR